MSRRKTPLYLPLIADGAEELLQSVRLLSRLGILNREPDVPNSAEKMLSHLSQFCQAIGRRELIWVGRAEACAEGAQDPA